MYDQPVRRGPLIAVCALGCGRLHFDAVERIELVQVQAPGFNAAAETSVIVSQTTGNLIVAAVYWDQAPNTVTFSDTAGLAWTALPKLEIGAGAGCGGVTGNATGAQLYYAQVTSTESNTLRATQTSGMQPLGIIAIEYSGLATADAVDMQVGQVAPSPSHLMSSPPITTTENDLIVAFFNDTIGAGTIGGGSGYVVQARDIGFPNLYEDAVMPPGTYTPTAVLPNAQTDACWIVSTVAFRPR